MSGLDAGRVAWFRKGRGWMPVLLAGEPDRKDRKDEPNRRQVTFAELSALVKAMHAQAAPDDRLEEDMAQLGEGRREPVRQIAQYFSYDHLGGDLRAVSKACHDLAQSMLVELPDSPELTVGLRKLLEAKDCFVRAALSATRPPMTDEEDR